MINAVPFAVPRPDASRHMVPPSVRSVPSELNDQLCVELPLHDWICTPAPLPVPLVPRHLPPALTTVPAPPVELDVVVLVGRVVVVVVPGGWSMPRNWTARP